MGIGNFSNIDRGIFSVFLTVRKKTLQVISVVKKVPM